MLAFTSVPAVRGELAPGTAGSTNALRVHRIGDAIAVRD